MEDKLKKRLLKITVLFCVLISIITCIFLGFDNKTQLQNSCLRQIVALNEIEQLAKLGKSDLMFEKISRLQEDIKSEKLVYNSNIRFLLMGGISILFLFVVFGYIYKAILSPFEKMKKFAQKLAQGNFDVPLNYERSNYFGEFTWAFDSMRREITKARACEKEAIDNNKTVIATLSHDIKTPIASIRAYAEGLEANLDTSIEKRYRYLAILIKKCDEVTALTNDLFLHSISDLEKLKISVEPKEIVSLTEHIIAQFLADNGDITYKKPDFKAMVLLDEKRFTQIIENIINNSRKYAKTAINISIVKVESHSLQDVPMSNKECLVLHKNTTNENTSYIELHFRDYGHGIPDKDMPFIFEKFYRGSNVKKEQGSGLGLYIVKYITEQMQGSILLHNHIDGLEVIITFPIFLKSS
jgi:signal transduction histidine kinase